MPGGRPKSDVFTRFKSKILIAVNGCHEWQSTIKKDGYGSFYFDGNQVQAHRVAYELFVGKIPKGMILLHTCDNRKCVNIEHLVAGTTQENISDMDAKGRRGTKSKLTYAQVDEIKKMLLDRKNSQQKIGELFGVDQTTISKIMLGRTTKFKK